MNEAMTVTLDAAGRLVVPKAVREASGILPGMPLRITCREGRIEIEPLPRDVRVVDRAGFRVAEPVATSEPLTAKTVRRTREGIRTSRLR